MAISPAPIQNVLADKNGVIQQVWVLWFNKIKTMLDNSRPWQLTKYTVATLPSATDYEGCIVYVSNEAGGKTLAFSDSVNWRRCQDRNVVS